VVGDGSALAKGVLRLISLENGARLVMDERLSAELLSGATSAALAARLRGEALVKTERRREGQRSIRRAGGDGKLQLSIDSCVADCPICPVQ
jgi:hypothetical protein